MILVDASPSNAAACTRLPRKNACGEWRSCNHNRLPRSKQILSPGIIVFVGTFANAGTMVNTQLNRIVQALSRHDVSYLYWLRKMKQAAGRIRDQLDLQEFARVAFPGSPGFLYKLRVRLGSIQGRGFCRNNVSLSGCSGVRPKPCFS